MDNQFDGYTKEQIEFINKKLNAAAKNAARSEKRIRSLFLESEIDLVRETWNKTETPLGIPFNDIIIDNINHYLNEKVDIKWNGDLDSMYKKIKKLTDYQAFTLVKVALKKDGIS